MGRLHAAGRWSALRACVLALALAIALTGGGCGLAKRSDATDPVELATVRKFASTLEQQSSVSRSSGQATYVRLTALFPAATGSLLPAQDFAFEGADGINRAFGQQARPFESLAQMALRAKAAGLCTTWISNSLTTIFDLKPGKQLLTGETPPADATQALVLAAVRNAWLHPYGLDAPEVQELLSLYAATKAKGTDNDAKKAVCMAVLLAPQFWMGAPEATDAAKRVSVEFFRRIPTMQELQDFADKKVSMNDYFEGLMKDATALAGFKSTIHEWHEEWLGFREFFDPSEITHDRRPSMIDNASGGASSMIAQTFGLGPAAGGQAQSIVANRVAGFKASSCVSNAYQDFDPDSSMIAWEHQNYDVGRFEFVGGFVRAATGAGYFPDHGSTANPGALDTVAALKALNLLTHFPDDGTSKVVINDLCNVNAGNYVTTDQQGVIWHRCNGLLTLNAKSSVRMAQTLHNIMTGIVQVWDGYSKINDTVTYPYNYWCGSSSNKPSCITAYNNYARYVRNLYIDDFKQAVNRIRSYSTSGVVAANIQTMVNGYVSPTGLYLYDTFMANFSTVNSEVDNFKSTVAAGTGANAWSYVMNLSEAKMPSAFNGNLGYQYGGYDRFDLYQYTDVLPNHFVDSGGDHGFGPADRRVHRLGGISGQWQDGYSTVKLWYTGGTVAVCNNSERLWASCFYRPNPGSITSGGGIASYRPDLGGLWSTFYTWTPDSAMHPNILTSMYCGLPSLNAIADHGSATTNAVYAPLRTNLSALNPVASNIDLQADAPAGDTSSAIGAESAIFQELYQQMRQEPYRLIEHLILEKDDYRKLLTANYTYGNKCLKFFYDTQGYYLPSHPEAAGAVCSGPGLPEEKFSAGDSIPIGHLTAVDGSIEGTNTPRKNMWDIVYGKNVPPPAIPPRLYSGIITMPAFIAPVATKARGISARYFARLLCSDPNFYDPATDPTGEDTVDANGQKTTKVLLATSFISRRKHLQAECFQCHRNLDPLASALSWTFRGLLTSAGRDNSNFTDPSVAALFPDHDEELNTLGGEGSMGDFTGELDYVSMKNRPIEGLRHGAAPKSHGAFMGQSVTGIEDLGAKVAASDQFAKCVVNTTFQYVFGRQVQFADVPYYKGLVKKFQDPNGVNYRYIDLLKTMITSDEYQKKN